MHLTYDSEADAAYLSVVHPIEDGAVEETVGFIDTPNGESQINLDFDADGRLLGIEILAASLALRADTLASAESA